MQLTPREANLLLYALDNYCDTDHRGKISSWIDVLHHMDHTEIQSLRDRLFDAHEHQED